VTSPLGTGKSITFLFIMKLYMLYVQYILYRGCSNRSKIPQKSNGRKIRKHFVCLFQNVFSLSSYLSTVFYSVAALYNDYQSEYHTSTATGKIKQESEQCTTGKLRSFDTIIVLLSERYKKQSYK